jgi:hypothetical protein
MVNQVIKVPDQDSKSRVRIWGLKFYLLWTDILSQQIFRIYWSRIVPYSQKRICSPWHVLQLWKTEKLWRSESFYFKGPNRANQPSFRLGTDFIQLLLNDYLYCKFHIFFDIEIWCVPVTQTIVQSLDITMEQFLSKVELSWICHKGFK